MEPAELVTAIVEQQRWRRVHRDRNAWPQSITTMKTMLAASASVGKVDMTRTKSHFRVWPLIDPEPDIRCGVAIERSRGAEEALPGRL
jgi:hypothetical protein